MTYNDCAAIIDQFKKAHPAILMAPNAHGIQVVQEADKFILQLVVIAKLNADQLTPDELMPSTFDYVIGGKSVSIETRILESPVPSPTSRQGATATYAAGGVPWGTAGWNIFLPFQNIWACVSNHHVLVDPANPNFGINIFLGGAHEAQLHAMTLSETWDWALARYNRPGDALQRFEPCSATHTYPDARELSQDVHFGEQYHKVGARTGCTRGKLLGVGDRRIGPYPDGVTRWFRGQLIYENMSHRGDSGSVIVRDQDNTVTGLLFAGANTDPNSIANPLYQIGWTYLGTFRLKNGEEVPAFDDRNSLVLTRPAMSDTGEIAQFHQSPASDAGKSNSELERIGGLVFLGEATYVANNPFFTGWEKPVPPAIRPVEVQKIFIRRDPLRLQGRYRDTFLCFG